MTSAHLQRSVIRLSTSKYLSHLDLSGNNIGDAGAGAISGAIHSSVQNNSMLPLQYLDLSLCHMSITGVMVLVEAIARKSVMRYLDLSDNNLSTTKELFSRVCVHLKSTKLHHIALNRCQLGSESCCILFQSLQEVSSDCCGSVLKVLLLSENDLHDRVGQSLCDFMINNVILEVLDLGFNQLTEKGVILAKRALKVISSSRLETKLNELHVNLIGNPCDPYALEFPGMARSKMLLRYADNKVSSTLENIPINAREHYKERKKIDNDIRLNKPQMQINFIS
jgi:Ran GTPase-activating protein (RanGAP) involved in mRNA processing and transport